MKIRVMTIKDYEKVYSLWLNTPGMGLNNLDDSKNGIAKYLLRNPNTCFVAEENQNIIGIILSGHDGRRGFVYHTAVSKNSQRQGIGTKLVNTAMKALKKEGVTKVALVVFDKNLDGNKFWEKQGFTIREDLIYRNKALCELEY